MSENDAAKPDPLPETTEALAALREALDIIKAKENSPAARSATVAGETEQVAATAQSEKPAEEGSASAEPAISPKDSEQQGRSAEKIEDRVLRLEVSQALAGFDPDPAVRASLVKLIRPFCRLEANGDVLLRLDAGEATLTEEAVRQFLGTGVADRFTPARGAPGSGTRGSPRGISTPKADGWMNSQAVFEKTKKEIRGGGK